IRDDGAVVYINGIEVFRSNMPTGTITYATRASGSASNAAETTWFETTINPAIFQAGVNVVTVEIHQDVPQTSDLSFNLSLGSN
ncbi:metallophosphoesterase, partial [Candidatus Parcubacteria bacterium]|nr:metallophosphoesterase [Candidatus Parcubacteria bacterium]